MNTEARITWYSTDDIGRVAAGHLADPERFNGVTPQPATWEGNVHDAASAMAAVTRQETRGKRAMPKLFRWLFLGCWHGMCNFFEAGGALASPGYGIAACRKLVPDAFTAEDWCRFHLTHKGLL
jgi:hypothetical protein